MRNQFKPYDHVIWDTDTDPRVCLLGHRIDGGHDMGFMGILHDEFISDRSLESARHATGKEIIEFYNSLGADIQL